MKPDRSPHSRFAVFYISIVLGLGAGFLGWEWTRFQPTGGAIPWIAVAFWTTLAVAAEFFWLETRTRAGTISISLAVHLAALFILPAPLVLFAGGLSVGLTDLFWRRRGVLKAAFNSGQTIISLEACLLILRLAAETPAGHGADFILTQPMLTLAVPVVFFLCNTLLVSTIISLTGNLSLWRVWRKNYAFGYQVLSSAVQFLIALGLVMATSAVGYIAGVLSLLLLFFVHDAYHRYLQDRRAGGECKIEAR